jgi:hypothetical protein
VMVVDAVNMLSELLPLKLRQQQLSVELRNLHRAILRSYIDLGRPLTRAEICPLVTEVTGDDALSQLASKDLVVLNREGQVVGAYPMTVEQTPHRVHAKGHEIHAMCAVDALAVSPMFRIPVRIDSRCRVTGEPIHIRQQDMEVRQALPSWQIGVGIQWRAPQACAAYTLCREMVFLKDQGAAAAWQACDDSNRDVFALQQAAQIAADFFKPLLD